MAATNQHDGQISEMVSSRFFLVDAFCRSQPRSASALRNNAPYFCIRRNCTARHEGAVMKRPFVQYAGLEPHFEKNNYLSNLSGQSGGEGGTLRSLKACPPISSKTTRCRRVTDYAI